MIKILLQKQLLELNRAFFFDAQKGKKRSKAAAGGMIVLYALLMTVVLGGIFTYLSVTLCASLTTAGADWLYFTIMGLIAVALGVFGSVFNTYASLYLAKDNDLLLSMPIPVYAILFVRLLGVYLMGLLYSGVVLVPAVIVYWVTKTVTVAAVIGSLLYIVAITLFVLVLSCLLGWVVAQIAVRMRHKNILTVLLSVLFLAAYYFVYFRAQTLLTELIANVDIVGAKLRGAAYPLYLLGKMGTGDPIGIVVTMLCVAAMIALTAFLLARSFLHIATTPTAEAGKTYTAGREKVHSPDTALYLRERARFTGSANYMLNCGMGILMMPVCAVLLLWKGGALSETAAMLFDNTEVVAAIVMGVAIMVVSMNTITSPSVSLEGNNLWIAQSLPVSSWQILRAKLRLHIVMTETPMLPSCICVAIGLCLTVTQTLALIASATAYVFFSAALGLMMNLLRPNLDWTNENAPIKQSVPVFVSLFGGWLCGIAAILAYFALPDGFSAALFGMIVTIVFSVAAALLLRWLRKTGAQIYAGL